MPSIEVFFVLVETKYQGNIGLAARAIKNFGFNRLILVNPICEVGREAYYRSMHAQDVLKSARIYGSVDEFVEAEEISFLIGTTAKVGSEKNPLRIAVPLNVIREFMFPVSSRIAILFGNEERGLKNDELSKCDIVVTIPTGEYYPTLNLAHAVVLVAYEFSLALKTCRELPYRPATQKEKEILCRLLSDIVEIVCYGLPEGKINIYKRIVCNIVGRAFLSGREAHSLIGIFKKVKKKISS